MRQSAIAVYAQRRNRSKTSTLRSSPIGRGLVAGVARSTYCRERVVVKAAAVRGIGAQRHGLRALDRGRIAHDFEAARVSEVRPHPATQEISGGRGRCAGSR